MEAGDIDLEMPQESTFPSLSIHLQNHNVNNCVSTFTLKYELFMCRWTTAGYRPL